MATSATAGFHGARGLHWKTWGRGLLFKGATICSVTSATPSDVAEVTGSAEELGVTVFKPGFLPVSTWATEKLPLEDSDRELLLLARSVHN